jgi:hypothetical protein
MAVALVQLLMGAQALLQLLMGACAPHLQLLMGA